MNLYIFNEIYLQKFSDSLNSLQTIFEQINNEQDKLITEFVKKIDIHIIDMLREVDQINIEANVIILSFYVSFYYKVLYMYIFLGIMVN